MRFCQSCPSRVLLNRDYCWACTQYRERQQAAAARRRRGQVPRVADFTPAQIEARFQRARAEQRYQAALRRLGKVA